MDNNRLCNKCGLLPQNGKKPEPCTCKPKCKKPCKKKCCGDGFAIGDVTGQSVTFYSIGAPSASVTLKVNYKG